MRSPAPAQHRDLKAWELAGSTSHARQALPRGDAFGHPNEASFLLRIPLFAT